VSKTQDRRPAERQRARTKKKAADFASEFSALGITIKLQELHLGHFTLANKEGRIPKIVQMLRKIKQQGRISRNEAAEVQEAVRPKS
jgi:hypothetical protein